MNRLTPLMLSQAGFDQESIINFINQQRPLLKYAGFSDMEINEAYGVKQDVSSVISENDVKDVTPLISDQTVGSKDTIESGNSLATSNFNKINQKKEEAKVTLAFEDLTEEDRNKIVEEITNANTQFKKKEEAEQHIKKWININYPSVSLEEASSLKDAQDRIKESILNEQKAKEYLEKKGVTGIDLSEEAAMEDWREQKRKNILHPNVLFLEGSEADTMLKYMTNKFNMNEVQAMNFKEFIGFSGTIVSDGKSIHNSEGTKTGLFQLTKGSMQISLNRFISIMKQIDPNWERPQWVTDAFFHLDMTKLLPDKQTALVVAYLIDMSYSERLKRADSDELIKKVLNGDKDAMQELQLSYLHAEYKKNQTTGEYELKTDQATKDKSDFYWNEVWGTPNYEYNYPYAAVWATEGWLTEKVEAIPYVGKKLVKWSGGKGHYNTWTNGKYMSVFGLFNLFEQRLKENPDADPMKILNEVFVWQNQRFSQEVIQSAVTLGYDAIPMGVGCLAAGGAAWAGTGGVPTPAIPIACMAGAFAVPEMFRDVYIRAIMSGAVNDSKEFMQHFMDIRTAWAFTKGAITGATTKYVGLKVSPTNRIGQLAAEIPTMVTVGSLLEGHLPTRKDFIHATILLGGMHIVTGGVGSGYKKIKSFMPKSEIPLPQKVLMEIYRVYGVHPRDVVKLAEKDITVKNQILDGEIPDVYKHASDKVIKGMEEASGIKLVEPAKFKLNEIVNLDVSGTKKGQIISKEIKDGQPIFQIKLDNGKIIPVLETEVRKAPTIESKVVIDKEGKIEIRNKDETEVVRTTIKQEDIIIPKEAKVGDVIEVFDIQGNKYKTKITAVNKNKTAIRVLNKEGKDVLVNMDQSASLVNVKNPNYQIKTPNLPNKVQGKVLSELSFEELKTAEKELKARIKDLEEGGKQNEGAYLNAVKDINAIRYAIHKDVSAVMTEAKEMGEKDQAGTNYERYNNTRETDNWGLPKEPIEPLEKFTSTDTEWKGLYHGAKGIDFIDLVELTKAFINKSPELENLSGGLRGYYRFAGKDSPKVVVSRILQENPEHLIMTMAHELGHLVDHLPDMVRVKGFERGNIIGRIATLKNHLNKWFSTKNLEPISKKEKARFKKEAIKFAKENLKDTLKEIKDLKITPETITKIINDPKVREWMDAKFYDTFARLDEALKITILKDAFKGLINPHIKALVDKTNKVKKTDPKLTAEAERIFAEKMEYELKRRGLVNREWIMKELKALSMKFKPWNRATAKKSYNTYRDSGVELMADFMMAWLLRPKWVKLNAPRSYNLWIEYIHRKPEVKKLYENIQMQIKAGSDARLADVFTKLDTMWKKSREKILYERHTRWEESRKDELGSQILDHFWVLYRRLSGPDIISRWKSPDTIKVLHAIEQNRYNASLLERYAKEMDKHVISKLEEINYTTDDFATTLLLRNLAESPQRENVMSTLGLLKHKDLTGLTERTVDKLWAKWSKMHPQLVPLTDKFYEVRSRMVISRLKAAKYVSPKDMVKIEDNVKYVTHNPIDKILTRIEKFGVENISTAHLKGTIGSVKDIANVLQSTMEKDFLLLASIRRNTAIQEIVNYFWENKLWLEDFDHRRKIVNGKEVKILDRIIEKPKRVSATKFAPPPKGMELLGYWENGKMKFVWINSRIAKGFRYNEVSHGTLVRWGNSVTAVWKKIFTEYNPRFWVRNFRRDIQRTVKHLPKSTYFDLHGGNRRGYIKYLIKNFIPTKKSIFEDGTKLTRFMEEEGYLISMSTGFRSQAGQKAIAKGMTEQDHMIEILLKKYVDRKQFDTLWEQTFGRLGNHIGNIARIFERWNKIAPADYFLEHRKELGLTEKEIMLRVQGEVGSPSFLRTGEWHPVLQSMLLYYNPFKEGWRSDVKAIRTYPQQVIGKYIAYQAMPKVWQKMAEWGFFGGAIALMYQGVSDWDKLNYIPIPIGYTADGRVIYWVTPQDESARVMNGILYKILGIGEDGLEELWKTPADMADYLSEQSPKFNPTISLLADTLIAVSGNTPFDNWRMDMAIPELYQKAGGHKRNIELLKWFWNTYGGRIVYKFKANNQRDAVGELQKILNIPLVGTILGSFVKIGTHPAMPDTWKAIEEYTSQDANITILAQEAIKYYTSGQADKVTKEHITALTIRSQALKGNKLLMEEIAHSTGATDLLVELIGTSDQKKQAVIWFKILEYMKKRSEAGNNAPFLFRK